MANTSTFKSTPEAVPPAGVNGAALDAERLKRSVAVRAIIAYPTLVTPDPEFGDNYQALLIVDKTDPSLKALAELIGDHVEKATGTRKLGGRFHNPLREGDKTARSGNGFAFRDEAFRGNKIVVRGKSKYQPKCVWGPKRTPCDPGDIEGGDHVIAELTAYWFDNQSVGVGVGLNALWLVRKGEHKIERGGRTGTSFETFDTAGIEFDGPEGGEETQGGENLFT